MCCPLPKPSCPHTLTPQAEALAQLQDMHSGTAAPLEQNAALAERAQAAEAARASDVALLAEYKVQLEEDRRRIKELTAALDSSTALAKVRR